MTKKAINDNEFHWVLKINGKEYYNGVSVADLALMRPQYLIEELLEIAKLNIRLTLESEML